MFICIDASSIDDFGRKIPNLIQSSERGELYFETSNQSLYNSVASDDTASVKPAKYQSSRNILILNTMGLNRCDFPSWKFVPDTKTDPRGL